MPSSASAAYNVVAGDLRDRIRSREFADGRQLPTEADLSAQYGLSRQTVRRAFQELVTEGLVERVPRRGTFAIDGDHQYLRQFGSIDELMGLSIDTEMEVVTPLHRVVDIEAAGRLRLSSDAVYTVRFSRTHDQIPFCVTAVHLPPEVGAALSDVPELLEQGARSTATVIGLIDQCHPERIVEAEQSITAMPASDELARELRISPGESLLRIDRLYLSAADVPMELATSYFLPSQYTYRVRLRRTGR